MLPSDSATSVQKVASHVTLGGMAVAFGAMALGVIFPPALAVVPFAAVAAFGGGATLLGSAFFKKDQ